MNKRNVSMKIFYVGFQRVGTKSFGRFMELNGFNVASWDVSSKYGWSELYSNVNFNAILNSKSFQFYDVFEDGPWFHPELVKFLYHEVKDSKFVMLKRPAEDWFKSMITHSAGFTLGNIRRHCEIYERMDDYIWLRQHTDLSDDMRLSLFDKPEHYMNVYNRKTSEIQLFFERMPDGTDRFFDGDLYDNKKYAKIAEFLKIRKPMLLDVSVHKSAVTIEDVFSVVNDAQNSTFRDVRNKNKLNKIKYNWIEQLRTWLKLAPNNHNLLYRLGKALYVKGDIAEAAKTVKRGLDCCPDYPRLHFLMSNVLEKQNDLPGAIKHIQVAINITDDNPSFHRRYGNLLRKDGRLQEAKLAHQRFTELAPYK
jgi:tetratricopeptide (TPR) repeat protein